MLRTLSALLARWFGTAPVADAPPPTASSQPAAAPPASSTELHTSPPPAQPVAYDENLLERARTQWQFGDWNSLAQLERDTLQHHPDRAKLALLAAAGRLQTDRGDEARLYLRLAQDWGVSKKLLAQILAAGVHNSLGRAAALAGKQTAALQHFKSAIDVGTPGAATQLLLQARTGEQLQQLGLHGGTAHLNTNADHSPALKLTPLATHIDTLTDALQEHKAELDAQLKKQADELIRVRKFLDSSLKNEVSNAAKQIEAFMGLQNYFATGELPSVNTERHSWPVSPDFAIYLIELIELNDYDLIIEFGSGISTVIVAKTLAKMASRRQGKPSVTFASFDHLDQYYQQTRAHLLQAGLLDTVQLTLSPLKDWQAPDDNTYPYYDCQSFLAQLAQTFGQPHTNATLRMLVIVDGPPSATGKHARYPAAPLILQHFSQAHIDLLLDDYIRADEKEIVQRWQGDITAAKRTYTLTERRLEKDACLIQIQSILPPLPGLTA